MLSINIKCIGKGLYISGFWIVEYYVSSESESMIALRAQAYYVLGLPNYLRIISPQGILTKEGYKGTFIDHFNDEYDSYAEGSLNKERPH